MSSVGGRLGGRQRDDQLISTLLATTLPPFHSYRQLNRVVYFCASSARISFPWLLHGRCVKKLLGGLFVPMYTAWSEKDSVLRLALSQILPDWGILAPANQEKVMHASLPTVVS